ncbi:MAG: hypothetical protein R3F34_01175 [Planctomycetota bacterium]
MRSGLVLVLACALGSCVQLSWRGSRAGLALADTEQEWALAARPDMQAALDRLGAPELVRESEGRGVELLWLWRRTDGFGFGVSVPLADTYSANFQWDETGDDALGLRLLFDDDGRFLDGSRGAVLRDRP